MASSLDEAVTKHISGSSRSEDGSSGASAAGGVFVLMR